MMSCTVHDNALSGSPMMANAGNGVATLSTDGCSSAGRVLMLCVQCVVQFDMALQQWLVPQQGWGKWHGCLNLMNAWWSKLQLQAPWGCGNLGGGSDARQSTQQKQQQCLDDWQECGVLDDVAPIQLQWQVDTTRCLMVHGWPHKTVNTVWARTLDWQIGGCGARQSRWSNEVWLVAIEWGTWM